MGGLEGCGLCRLLKLINNVSSVMYSKLRPSIHKTTRVGHGACRFRTTRILGYKYGDVLMAPPVNTAIIFVIFHRFLIKSRCLSLFRQATCARSSSRSGLLCHFRDIAFV